MSFQTHIVDIGDKILFDGQARSVMLPGVEGEFEVVDHHGSIAALLAVGMITVITRERNMWQTQIEQGVVRFDGKSLTAIVE